jgi:hypothetical protein
VEGIGEEDFPLTTDDPIHPAGVKITHGGKS